MSIPYLDVELVVDNVVQLVVPFLLLHLGDAHSGCCTPCKRTCCKMPMVQKCWAWGRCRRWILLLELILRLLWLSCSCKTSVVEPAVETDADLLTESSCCSRSHQSSCSAQCCCCHYPSMLVISVGQVVVHRCPVEKVDVLPWHWWRPSHAMALYPILKKLTKMNLLMVFSYSLLLSKWSLSSISLLSMLLMTSLNVLLVVDVLLDVVVPFFSVEVIVKDVVVEQFLSANFCWTTRCRRCCVWCSLAYCFAWCRERCCRWTLQRPFSWCQVLLLNPLLSIFLLRTSCRDRRRWCCWFSLCFAGRWGHSRCWAPRCPFSCCQASLFTALFSIFLLRTCCWTIFLLIMLS